MHKAAKNEHISFPYHNDESLANSGSGAGDNAVDKRQTLVPSMTAGSVSWQLSVFWFRAPALVFNWILNQRL